MRQYIKRHNVSTKLLEGCRGHPRCHFKGRRQK